MIRTILIVAWAALFFLAAPARAQSASVIDSVVSIESGDGGMTVRPWSREDTPEGSLYRGSRAVAKSTEGKAQAHATGLSADVSASDAIAALCPTRPALAPLVEAAAARHHVQPVVLVAQFRVEASCDPMAVNLTTRSYGAMGIKLDGSANVDHLEAAELMDPSTNFDLGARHLRRWSRTCGSIPLGLAIYHAGAKKCSHGKGDGYAKRVLSLVAWAKRTIQRLQEKRS